MARRYLGDRFDLHTGGIDNIFPHHEDEIAQSAPLVGGPPARVWVHGEHLLMAGRKMAKSAGNFQRVTELIDEGIDPLAFRYLVLTSRYGHKLNYSDTSIGGAAAALASLRARLAALGPPPADGPWAAPPVARGRRGRRPTRGHGRRARRVRRRRRLRRSTDRAHGPVGAALPRWTRAARPVRGGARRRPRPAGGARRGPRDPARRPAGRRAALAGARCRRGPRARPASGLGACSAARGRGDPGRGHRAARCERDAARAASRLRAGGRAARRDRRAGWDVVDAPDGLDGRVAASDVAGPLPAAEDGADRPGILVAPIRAASGRGRRHASSSDSPVATTWCACVIAQARRLDRDRRLVDRLDDDPDPERLAEAVIASARSADGVQVADGRRSRPFDHSGSSCRCADEQVAARAEPVDDPVEVALRLAGPLVLREARPAAVLVADRRAGRRARTARRGGSPSPSSRSTRLHQMSRLR